MPRPVIRRDTLAEQVAEGLIALITELDLKPGDTLAAEAKLAADFEVSRPVVREALRYLQAVGVVEITNGRRAVVQAVTSEPLKGFFRWALHIDDNAGVELLELRRGIETQSAMLAAERATDDELAEIRSLVEAMNDHLHDADAFEALDARMHLAVAAASHNAMMGHLVESLRAPIQASIREGLHRKESDAERRRVVRSHVIIVEALARRDVEASRDAMAEHFDRAIKLLIAGMDARAST